MRRSLRGIEKTMVRVGHEMGPDLVVGEHTGMLSTPLLQAAVNRLQMQHAALRCRVNGDQLIVEGPRNVRVRRVDGDWRSHAEAELSRPLALHLGQAFRVLQAPGAVILSVHHALVDGTSLLVLLRDLFAHCEALEAGDPEPVAFLPLSPAVMDSVAGPAWQDLAGPIAAQVAPWVLAADQLRMRAEGAREGAPCSITAFGEGSPAGLKRLVGACKARGVSVGGAAMAAGAFAMGRLRAQRTGVLSPVPIECEVDLRRRAEPPLPGDRVGFHTGGCRTSAPAANMGFWELASWLKSDVETDIARGLPRFAHCIADGLDWQPEPLPGSWVAVSNLGRFAHRQDYGSRRLTGVYGMNGAVSGGPAAILWLRCIEGRLCFNAVASHPTLSRAELQQVSADFLGLLEDPTDVSLGAWSARAVAA